MFSVPGAIDEHDFSSPPDDGLPEQAGARDLQGSLGRRPPWQDLNALPPLPPAPLFCLAFERTLQKTYENMLGEFDGSVYVLLSSLPSTTMTTTVYTWPT